jgi:hypothetical protein
MPAANAKSAMVRRRRTTDAAASAPAHRPRRRLVSEGRHSLGCQIRGADRMRTPARDDKEKLHRRFAGAALTKRGGISEIWLIPARASLRRAIMPTATPARPRPIRRAVEPLSGTVVSAPKATVDSEPVDVSVMLQLPSALEVYPVCVGPAGALKGSGTSRS